MATKAHTQAKTEAEVNQTEAKRFVWKSVASSCRKWASRITMGDLGPKTTQKDVNKVKAALRATAEIYEKKLGVVAIDDLPRHLEGAQSEVEAGASSPGNGANDLPEDGEATGAGEANPAAGQHKPKARRR